MRPTGVHHVSINVADVSEARRFYCEILGLPERTDRPDLGIGGAWLDAGAEQVHLVEAPVPPSLGQHFALAVGDLDTVVGELRSQGVDVSDPSVVGTGRQSFVSDPFGNTVELHQPRA